MVQLDPIGDLNLGRFWYERNKYISRFYSPQILGNCDSYRERILQRSPARRILQIRVRSGLRRPNRLLQRGHPHPQELDDPDLESAEPEDADGDVELVQGVVSQSKLVFQLQRAGQFEIFLLQHKHKEHYGDLQRLRVSQQ